MKHFGYLMLLLIFCLPAKAGAVKSCKQEIAAAGKLQPTMVKSRLPGHYQDAAIAHDIFISSAVNNPVQPLGKPVIQSGHSTGTMYLPVSPVTISFAIPIFAGNSQLLHNYPFHNFW